MQELLLHPLNEALEEHVLLVNERDGDVGDGLGAAAAYLLAVDSRVEVCAAEGGKPKNIPARRQFNDFLG
ncbi:MAG: hypothetical protein SPE56_08755 [Prevotella sp.]|nr:hypothetical protein [Prevotella sp.]